MPRRKQKSNGLRYLLWTLVVLLVIGAGTAITGYMWVQSYLHSAAFRQMIAQRASALSNSEVKIEALNLTGSAIYIPRATMTPLAATGWKTLEADRLNVTLDTSTWRQGVWTVPRVEMDGLRLEMDSPSPTSATGKAATSDSETDTPVPAPDPSGALPGWLRSWIPQRAEINGVYVQSFDLVPPRTGGAEIAGMRLNGQPATGESTWLLRGEGGTLQLPGINDSFRITSASASVDGKALSLNDSLLRWIGDSEVTGRGDLPFDRAKGWSFNGRYTNLDLRYIISKDWQGKVTGVLEGDFETSSHSPTPILFKTKAKIKNGVLQNLAILNHVADFTRTDRFRRVVLDEASGTVEHQGQSTKISALTLQSNGLVRVEGDLLIQGNNVSGSFHVGVFPETLRWIPGAQGHVFTEALPSGPPGFVWTTLHISGTLDDPREDLSNRLLAAAGQAILLDAPMSILGKSSDVIEKSGGAGKAAVEGGRDLIHGAGDVLGKGLNTVKDLVPLLGK